MPIQAHLAALRAQHTAGSAQQRRFASAVGPNQSHHFPFPDLQADLTQGWPGAIKNAQRLDFEGHNG
jgi:hypothetical protein